MAAVPVRDSWCSTSRWWGLGRALLLAGALVAAASAQALQLADGQVVLAHVEDVYGEGLRVQRLDNGGVLELRWDQLTAACAQRIKVANGLAGDDQGELTATVTEVRYLQNGAQQTILGRVVDNSAVDKMIVQQKGVQFRIPRAEILQVRPVEVPVSQVFTPDEFYAQRLTEVAPGDVADKHRLLAEDLVRVRDYQRALDHLNRAKELANSRAPEQIDALIERVKLYVSAHNERVLLDGIQIARTRGTGRDFETGAKLIAQFEKDYPQSRLKGEFEVEKKRFAEARTRCYSQQVADAWRRAIQTVADKKMQEDGLTLAAAKDYASSKMSEDIAATVAQRQKLEVEEVRQLWSVRDKYPAGRRTEHFSYGIGSWVLGESAITKDTKQGAAGKQAIDPQTQRDLDRLTKALQKLQERSRAQGKAQGQGPGHEQTDEEWWSSTDRPERTGWLRAYYAEFSGTMVLTGAFTQPCFNCQGLGVTSELGPNNKIIKVKCYMCHNTKWLRSFKAY